MRRDLQVQCRYLTCRDTTVFGKSYYLLPYVGYKIENVIGAALMIDL